MNLRIYFALCFAALAVTCSQAAAPAQLATSVTDQIDELIQLSRAGKPITLDNLDPLYRAAVLQDGNVEPLLQWLSERRANASELDAKVLAEIEVHVAARRGDLQHASDVLETLLKSESVADNRVDLRLWLARLYDALGEVSDAKEQYQSLLDEKLSPGDEQMVRMRLALMGLLGTAPENNKADGKALIELATSSQDVEFRNRAANVLAVQNQHAEAVKLFTVEGKETNRFRGATRVTEWAIRANERDQAIENGWDAARSAQLKRDRRYALALLVEAYRMKATPKPAAPAEKQEPDADADARPNPVAARGAIAVATPDGKKNVAEPVAPKAGIKAKPGLEALIEAFEEESRGNALTDEMRSVWVELLRELGRNEDAIALFKSSADGKSGFSIEMRRELLEMEGAAGNIDQLIASYRDLIKSEPSEFVWRGGLTRVLLEQGQEQAAADLWIDYIGQLSSGTPLLMAAQTLGEVGLDDLAMQAVERMVSLKTDHGQALLYLADLQQRRGHVDEAEATLNRLDEMTDVDDAVRSELANAFERVGRQDKAIEVVESIRASRETIAEDVEMRLAWLYSEVGDEEKALQQWLTLWRKITSIPRRRYVEDRLMTVASRLGTLADIAIELEEKLADQTADDREAGLLVRIYSRVNDSVAASEILEEYMTQTGRNEVERLQEKGRIYQVCNDYWNYEKVIEQLIIVDPDGETEYLRQLALSMLERGKAQEARRVLLTLRGADDGKDSIGGEFEAGVLSLVGMNREAADAYRRGIAKYPDRIESYLLLANLLKDMGQTDRAVGMFQYLAENADRDDLFTIAIDGLLNMEAKGNVMQWARRITLERLAGREDKNYLYQLLADLSAEVNDKQGQIRAMENSLAVSGTRRLSVLRECMDLSSKIRGGAFYSSSSRGPTNAGNKPFFAFGRRLIGLGELMPPQVFLDLGQAFLADGDVVSAERTFGLAKNLADERAYQRQVAEIFERSGKRSEALVRYDRLLRTSPSDVALIARVAKLNEQEGHDDVAFRFYQRGFNLLLDQTPLTTQEDKSKNTTSWSYRGNRDAYQTYSDRLLRGVLVTIPDDSIETVLTKQRSQIKASLAELSQQTAEGREAKLLADSPRVEKRSAALRRMYFAFDRIDDLESLESELIRAFTSDQNVVADFARNRIAHGRYDSVRRLIKQADPSPQQQQILTTILGEVGTDSAGQQLAPMEMWRRFLPAWMSDDSERALQVLRKVDQSQGTTSVGRVSYMVINGTLVPQQRGSATTVSAWMRMALQLGDEGLALRFARSRLQQKSRYGSTGIKQLFDGYRQILPAESFRALARFAANLYKDDEDRTVEYLWIISQLREQLADEFPADEKLLEMVEESDLQLGYQFPFSLAMETFPQSIRSQAMAHVMDGIDKKSRPRELIRIPFQHETPIDEGTARAILAAIESGVQPALQDNYLKYAIYYLPRQGTALRCQDNAELAIAALDLLSTDAIRKRDDVTPIVAQNVKAVILHQSGRTDEALDLVVPNYDPDETISDYYLRYSRDWAYRELIPDAPQRFLDALNSQVTEGKPTVKQTDQKLALVKRADSDALMRQTYLQAIEDHPDQSKYTLAYERWEQQAKRIFHVIAFKQQQLSKLQESEPDQAKAKTLNRQLSELRLSVDQYTNGVPDWVAADEEDKKRFEKEQKTREKSQRESRDPKTPAITKPVADVEQISAPAKKKKSYPKTIAGVKSALEVDDPAAARQSLREVWRGFPAVIESPYGYRSSQKRLNGLAWPADPADKKKSEPTADEQRVAAEAARNLQRGGLAVFSPAKAKPPKEKPESAWHALATEPVGIAEMQRITRSRTPTEMNNVTDVVLGLLHADRIQKGDDVVFDTLVERIESGQSGSSELTQFFAMLEEDPNRINESNQSVIDVLLQQLDLTQLKMASQLADVCGSVGQLDRASALYTHCALLSPSRGVTFPKLIEQAGERFKEDQLMELAERMFAVATHDELTINQILDLRMELLSPAEVVKRSAVLFTQLDADPLAFRVAQAMRGAQLFAQVGDLDRATQCLTCALLQHGNPAQLPNSRYYYGSSRNVSLARSELIRVFPEDAARFDNYAAWLAAAGQHCAELIESGKLAPDIAIECQAIIAYRQCQSDEFSAAADSLSCVTTGMVMDTEAKKHAELMIDVMRAAEQFESALDLESALFQQNELSYLRFADLLSDTIAVQGEANAISLVERLLKMSQEKNLVDTALRLSDDDSGYRDRVTALSTKIAAAREDFKSRSSAAAARKKERAEWQAADREAAAEKQQATSATSTRAPVPLP